MIFYIFPGERFAQLGTFSVVGDWNLFSGIIFSLGVEIIYSRAYWLFKIWLYTPVWIKNGTTQCMGLVSNSLLADLMTMIWNWKKTDGDFSALSCVQASI